MVSAGSSITFTAIGQTAGYVPIDSTDLRTAVVDRLSLYFIVTEVSIARGSFLGNLADFQWLHWNYNATVTIKTRLAYGSIDDVRSVIANAFYVAGGAIPTVTIPADGERQQPGDVPTGPNPFTAIKDLISQTEFLVIGGIIVIVGLVMFSPAGKAAAGRLHV